MATTKAQDGVELYYEVHGDGEPIVFVHGGGGNTLVWFQQVPHFSRTHRVITVDLRGFKHSRCPIEHIHPRYFPGDLLSILDAEGIDQATLACQSLGAWAGMPLAVHHPERVKRLFISGSPTPLHSPPSWRVLEQATQVWDFRQGEMRSQGIGWNRETLARRPELVFLYSQLKAQNTPGFRAATMTSEAVRIAPESLEEYAVPTLVCGGAHDDFLTPTVHLDVAAAIPGCRSYTFQHAGHSPYFESAQEYNEVLDDFLRTT
ncbi:MAG: alpha/beta fold hydrolase [Pigmentiphaga sp.]|uniref:alpha/beta fold hydrolase n=1 Tax=Pigmentiphaga sp. TaxID=1977564 RepID=UPI003B53AF5A